MCAADMCTNIHKYLLYVLVCPCTQESHMSLVCSLPPIPQQQLAVDTGIACLRIAYSISLEGPADVGHARGVRVILILGFHVSRNFVCVMVFTV